MTSNQRAKAAEQLKKLSPDLLAEALLDLAENSSEAQQVVESLATPPEKAAALFKRKLSGIKRRKKFYYRSQAGEFARELEALLELLMKPEIPPKEVIAALVSFYQADSKLMEMADDSYGDMGYVFQFFATELFAKTAAKIDDQAFLIKTFKKLYEENDYGARDAIADHAAAFLTPESIEQLLQHYSQATPKTEYDSTSTILTKALSAQLKSPEKFEAEIRKHSDNYYRAHIVQLAELYQAAGRHAELEKRLAEFRAEVRELDLRQLENIAVETYRTLGDNEAAKAIRSEQFLSHPSELSLAVLSEFADSDEVGFLKKQATNAILEKRDLCITSLLFLQHTDQHLLANEYLLSRHELINGDQYSHLPTLAKTFEAKSYPLAASLIWRALAESILDRAYNKAYPYAARYLEKLHALSFAVSDWLEFSDNQSYIKQLHATHFRKKSFWSKVSVDIQKMVQDC